LNLHLLGRFSLQPWAMRQETLATFTQMVLGGDYRAAALSREDSTAVLSPGVERRADTSWNVLQWDRESGEAVRKPYKMSPGYTAFNLEGVLADLRGTLPPVPEGLHVMLVWGALGPADV
jgi:hypothetical protein